jgi:UrcA family protein
MYLIQLEPIMSKYFNILTPTQDNIGVSSRRPGRYAMLKSAAILAVAVSLSNLSPALLQAAEPDQVVLKVSFADLDLSSEAGRAALNSRIQIAATAVCGGSPGGRVSLQEIARFRSCRDQAIAGSSSLVTAAIDAANQKSASAAANSKVASQEFPR